METDRDLVDRISGDVIFPGETIIVHLDADELSAIQRLLRQVTDSQVL